MNNGLLYLGCFLALLLAALFGVPYAVDWNGYRGLFEEEATKVMGRDVRVGGGVSVRLLPTPYVRFEKVRLADTTGQTGEPFLRADSFTMRLAVSPLLRGAFEATDIEIAKPVLSLVPDQEGSGNWASLELHPAELPFIPQNVALHSVRLVDGMLTIHKPEGGGVSRIELINGELSAETLKGPFKFKGTGVLGGAQREIKVATYAPEPNGVVRLKAAMHGADGENSYLFDGQVEDFASKPKVSGDLTGKLVLRVPQSVNGSGSKEAPPVFELKSAIKADARGATFDAVELALDSSGEPQIITGKATAQWSGDSRMDAELAAKWLDLDLLAAPKGEQSTITGLKTLFVTLMDGLDGAGSTSIHFDVDQVKFGGEQAGSLQLNAERRQDLVVLRQLKSGLPGGARIELAGEITLPGQGKSPSFTGEGSVRGVNFEKADAIAQRSGIGIDLKSQGPFWLAGTVAMNDTHFAITNAKAEFGGQPVSGEIDIVHGERKRVAVRLEGDRIDSAIFFPDAAGHVTDVLRQALGQQAGVPGSNEKPATAGPDTAIHIAAGELYLNGSSYKDVDASLGVEGRVLHISSARFTLPRGGRFTASGRVDTNEGAKGGLSYTFDGANKAALEEAAKLTGLSEVIGQDGLNALPSLQIAGLVKLGQRGPSSADLTFGGTAGAARLSGDAGFEGGFTGWKTAPVRFMASAHGGDVSQLLGLIGTDPDVLKGLKSRQGDGTVAVSGLLVDGAKTYADVNAEGLTASISGTLKLTPSNTFAHSAAGTIKARDVREALALAGLSAPAGVAQNALEGPIAIAMQDGKLSISSPGLKASGAVIRGNIDVARGQGTQRRIEGVVEADRVSVAGLFSWLTDAEAKAAAPTDDAIAPVWPDTAFNLDALSRVEGTVKLKAASLELSDDLAARNVTTQVVLSAGKVTLANLAGKAAGGELSGDVAVEKGPAGVSLSADLNLDADLAALSPRASGRAVISLTGSGRGLNPADAIAAFGGKGALKLADARHPGPSAALVADASDAVLAGKIAGDPATLTSALVSGLNQAIAVAGSRTIPFAVTGGDVKIESYSIEGAQGAARVTTTASLSKLLLDSEWDVAAVASPMSPPPEAGPDWRPAPKGPLPAVNFVYTGRLADLGHLQVDVKTDDLARELTARAMERKVEELEVMRRRDEERRLQEIDKRKKLELERQQAAEAAAAAKAAQQSRTSPQADQPAPADEQLPPVIPESNAERGKSVPQAGLAGEPVDPAVTPSPGDPAAADPSKGAQPAPAAQPRAGPPRFQQRPQRSSRSTTSEDINKAFGAWP